MLKLLGDNKTIYRECTCIKKTNPNSFVDNVIKINGLYLPVEVKLSVSAENNIVEQLRKYCKLEKIVLTKDKIITTGFYNERVLVIDTEKVYMYSDESKKLSIITELDKLSKNDDIIFLRNTIKAMLLM